MNPAEELPGLILAIDEVRGPVTLLLLAAEGWDSHPRRLSVNGRPRWLGYVSSQPTGLLTALCANGDRVDLLVIPPNTTGGAADAAMILAAITSNPVHARPILRPIGNGVPRAEVGVAEAVWEDEGGRLGPPGTGSARFAVSG